MRYLIAVILLVVGVGCTESRPSSERRAQEQKQVLEPNGVPASQPGPSMGSGNPITGNTGEAAGGANIGRDPSTRETMPVNEKGRTAAAGSEPVPPQGHTSGAPKGIAHEPAKGQEQRRP